MKFAVGESGVKISAALYEKANSEVWLQDEIEELFFKCLKFGKLAKSDYPELKFMRYSGGSDASTNMLAYKVIIRRKVPFSALHEAAHILAGRFFSEWGHAFIFKYYLQNLVLAFGNYILEVQTHSQERVDISMAEYYYLIRKAKIKVKI